MYQNDQVLLLKGSIKFSFIHVMLPLNSNHKWEVRFYFYVLQKLSLSGFCISLMKLHYYDHVLLKFSSIFCSIIEYYIKICHCCFILTFESSYISCFCCFLQDYFQENFLIIFSSIPTLISNSKWHLFA